MVLPTPLTIASAAQSWSDPARALTNRVVDLSVGYGTGRTKCDGSVALSLNLAECGRASSTVVNVVICEKLEVKSQETKFPDSRHSYMHWASAGDITRRTYGCS